MSSLSFGTIKSMVSESSSLHSSDATRVAGFVNEILLDFCDRTSILQDTYVFDLVAGTSKYPIITELTDFLRFRTMNLTGGNLSRSREIMMVSDLIEYHEIEQDYTDTGSPTHAVVAGMTNLLVVPTPDDAYDITGVYVKSAPVLSSDNDVPAIPAKYHQAIVDGTISVALRWDRQPEWVEYRNVYEEWIARCKNDIKRVSGIRPRALRPNSDHSGSGRFDNWVDRVMD
jgi:hypothetical protein